MPKLLFLQHCDAPNTICTTFRGPSNMDCAQKLQAGVCFFSYIIIKSIPFIYLALWFMSLCGCVPPVQTEMYYSENLSIMCTSPTAFWAQQDWCAGLHGNARCKIHLSASVLQCLPFVLNSRVAHSCLGNKVIIFSGMHLKNRICTIIFCTSGIWI